MDGCTKLALGLVQIGRVDDAFRYVETAGMSPQVRLDTLYRLGVALRRQDRTADAVRALQQVLSIAPEHMGAVYNLALTYDSAGQRDEAMRHFERVTEALPMMAGALYHLGCNYGGAYDLENAALCFRRAAAIDEPQVRLASRLLDRFVKAGDHDVNVDGWPEYARWFFRAYYRIAHANKPHWRGERLNEKSLLVFFDGGFGDTIQMLRYLPLVQRRARGRVFFLCQAELVSLLEAEDGLLSGKAGERIELLVADKSKASKDLSCDFRVNLMSLPLVFRTQTTTIPGRRPYLTAKRERVAAFAERIRSDRGRLRVGLRWAGNPVFSQDATRSCPLAELAPILRRGEELGVTFYSLQKGAGAEDLAEAAQGASIIDLTDELKDFADTAALIANLDLVISVDTSVAHLAGALGKPVWMLLPRRADIRWLRTIDATPWYPSMRLFRQSRGGGWAQLAEQVAVELERAVSVGALRSVPC